MKYKISYHVDAENDIKHIKKWYKTQQDGLEKRFSLAVKDTINYIIQNPLLFEVKYKNIRVAYTRVFPYGVHYLFHNNSIKILAVIHTSKKPKF